MVKPLNDQVTSAETAEILRLATKCLSAAGDFAELGCYRGDTSVLLGQLLAKNQKSSGQFSTENQTSCGKPVENYQKSVDFASKSAKNFSENVENFSNPVEKLCKTTNPPLLNNQSAQPSSEKKLWIYDSFAGLPEKTREDLSGAGQNFRAGELLVTKREVIAKLRRANLHNVMIKKAWFDELTPQDLPSQIAFAFLDGDLYQSIKVSLQLVAPLLSEQGIVIVHDYNNPKLPGSARAVDEFLRAHPNFRLSQKHALAILTRNSSRSN